MNNVIGTIREFRTKQFRVIVDALEEDSPDLSWDETGEAARKIDDGTYLLFCARVRVIHDELGELGADYLGNCVYESLEAFMDHKECGASNRKALADDPTCVSRCGSYFTDMIHQAISMARERIASVKRTVASIYVRGVQQS